MCHSTQKGQICDQNGMLLKKALPCWFLKMKSTQICLLRQNKTSSCLVKIFSDQTPLAWKHLNLADSLQSLIVQRRPRPLHKPMSFFKKKKKSYTQGYNERQCEIKSLFPSNYQYIGSIKLLSKFKWGTQWQLH